MQKQKKNLSLDVFCIIFLIWAYFMCGFVQMKETPLSDSSTEEAFQGEIN